MTSPPTWPGAGALGIYDGAWVSPSARPRQPQRRGTASPAAPRPGPCTRPRTGRCRGRPATSHGLRRPPQGRFVVLRTGLRPPLTRPPSPWAGDTGRLGGPSQADRPDLKRFRRNHRGVSSCAAHRRTKEQLRTRPRKGPIQAHATCVLCSRRAKRYGDLLDASLLSQSAIGRTTAASDVSANSKLDRK
jgi:hypothetical protein